MRTTFWLLTMGAAAWLGWNSLTAGGSPLYAAFRATGAAPTGYAINDWVVVPDGAGASALKAAAKELATATGVPGPVHETHGATWVKWTAGSVDGSVATRVIAERLLSGADYLVIDRSVTGGLTDYREAAKATFSRLSPYGSVHQNLTLIGTVPGRLTPPAERRLLGLVLTTAGGTEVNSVADREIVSLSAYAPHLGPGLTYSGRRVNLEAALSYNPETDSTEVLVGSPVITVTY